MILAGDIGGTKSLLALYRGKAKAPAFERRYASADFPDVESLLARFLDESRAALRARPRIGAACLGVAGPVVGERVQVTNLPWIVEAAGLGRRFAIGRVRLLNDFAAAAWGVDLLEPADLVMLQPGEPRAGAPRVVIGAGTGLGIAYIMPGRNGARPIAGEGGHGAFAPSGEEQVALWRHLHRRSGRVTLEDVVSGPGLVRVYDWLRQRGGSGGSAGRGALRTAEPAAEITRLAIERADPLACAALDCFIACYGAAAGDHALNIMARGGVLIAGGIAPRILPRLRAGGFLAAFNDKGAYSAHVRRMPVGVVVNDRMGLMGAAAVARGAGRRIIPVRRGRRRD
jgi:glucokinase